MKRAHIFVSGFVQGVFFRAFTERKANELGINGWARNMPDGRVEIVAEGSKNAIDELISCLRIGPPRARVESVDVRWEEPSGGKSFRVIS